MTFLACILFAVMNEQCFSDEGFLFIFALFWLTGIPGSWLPLLKFDLYLQRIQNWVNPVIISLNSVKWIE